MVQNIEIYAYFLFPFSETFTNSLSREKIVFKDLYAWAFLLKLLTPLSTHIYVVSENIPFSIKVILILLMAVFCFCFCKNQRFLAKLVPLLKAIV